MSEPSDPDILAQWDYSVGGVTVRRTTYRGKYLPDIPVEYVEILPRSKPKDQPAP